MSNTVKDAAIWTALDSVPLAVSKGAYQTKPTKTAETLQPDLRSLHRRIKYSLKTGVNPISSVMTT